MHAQSGVCDHLDLEAISKWPLRSAFLSSPSGTKRDLTRYTYYQPPPSFVTVAERRRIKHNALFLREAKVESESGAMIKDGSEKQTGIVFFPSSHSISDIRFFPCFTPLDPPLSFTSLRATDAAVSLLFFSSLLPNNTGKG